jgi:hypothetical protein
MAETKTQGKAGAKASAKTQKDNGSAPERKAPEPGFNERVRDSKLHGRLKSALDIVRKAKEPTTVVELAGTKADGAVPGLWADQVLAAFTALELEGILVRYEGRPKGHEGRPLVAFGFKK